MKFIKLDSINAANKENDTPIHIRTDHILLIVEATLHDRNIRSDMESIVYSAQGSYAVKQIPKQIIELIAESELV